MNNQEFDKLFLEFTNEVFCRRDSNQLKADKLWKEIKNLFPERTSKDFEIDWGHYLLNQLSYEQFGMVIIELKKFGEVIINLKNQK